MRRINTGDFINYMRTPSNHKPDGQYSLVDSSDSSDADPRSDANSIRESSSDWAHSSVTDLLSDELSIVESLSDPEESSLPCTHSDSESEELSIGCSISSSGAGSARDDSIVDSVISLHVVLESVVKSERRIQLWS